MADTPRIEDLKRRVQSDPASIAFAALAEEYRRAGQFDEAIAVCTAGLVRHPSYLSAHVTLGRALIEVGRFDAAKDELEYVLNLAPENLAAIRGLAEIHHRRGEDMHEQYAAADAARYGVGGTESTGAPAADRAAAPSGAATMAPASPPNPFPEVYASAPVPPAEPVRAAPPPAAEVARTDPALARLEGFLHAIMRARTQRVAVR